MRGRECYFHRPAACRPAIHRVAHAAGVERVQGAILTYMRHQRRSYRKDTAMRVSLTLTATSQVHIDDEDTSVTLHATPTGEATTASAQTEPSVDSPYEDPTEEGPVREGMYGPMHWLDDRHVTALLAPYICEGWDTGDYARFADLSGEEARRLRTLLPPLARDDRQNNAPRISDLLRAATRIDGLTLEGYVIHAPRWDERVSIDTVCVPESAIIAHTGRPIDDASCPAYEHWLTLAQVLGLGADAVPPDEMRFLVRDASSTRWWWAWWD